MNRNENVKKYRWDILLKKEKKYMRYRQMQRLVDKRQVLLLPQGERKIRHCSYIRFHRAQPHVPSGLNPEHFAHQRNPRLCPDGGEGRSSMVIKRRNGKKVEEKYRKREKDGWATQTQAPTLRADRVVFTAAVLMSAFSLPEHSVPTQGVFTWWFFYWPGPLVFVWG